MSDQEKTIPNKRIEQKKKTRQKLLRATVDLIATQGFDGVSMSKVTQRAGLSRAMCNYHFETKEQLMIEAFQLVYHEHESAWRRILGDAGLFPVERITKLITTLLSPPIAEKNKLAVWLAFWGVRSTRQTYFELCAKTDREYEHAISDVLCEITGSGEPVNGMSIQSIAVSLTGIIDGLGLQYIISPGQLTPNEAIRSCKAYLSSFFHEFIDHTTS